MALEAGRFGEEVLSLLPELLACARHLAPEPSEAEDLVAEAVGRAWERRGDLREEGRFRGWLFGILRNGCLARRRRERTAPRELPLPDSDEAPFSLFDRVHQPFLLWWGNPEEEFLNRLLKEDFERALRDLPEAHREVVVLADVQGFAYAEIADALGIPVGTVRSRLARARAKLQECLWHHAVDEGLREPRSPAETRPS